jgi:hypothetical protein
MRLVTMCALMLSLPADLWSQSLEVSQPDFSQSGRQMVWTYTVSAKKVAAATKVTLWFEVPASVTHRVSDSNGDPVATQVAELGVLRQFRYDIPQGDSVTTLALTGVDVLVADDATIDVKLQLDGQPDATSVVRRGPSALYDPSLFRLVFGAGATVRQDDWVDYRIDKESKRLFVENDSRLRASGIVGGLFKVAELTQRGGLWPVDLMLSLEYAADTQRMLDGFVFGATIGVNKYVSVGGGFALRRGFELSKVFEERAYTLAEEALRDPVLARQFAGLQNLRNDPELFDGFPLVDPRTNQAILAGEDPIRPSFNRSWFVGVFIPVDLAKLIRGGA